jgi:hypothetical protein
MPISINGTGTITGISAGGLPDACVTAADLASGAAKANFGAGCVLQVVQGVVTTAISFSTVGSWNDITGLSASITPSNTSNKILVIANIKGQASQNTSSRVIRDSTAIGVSTEASPGSRLISAGGDFYGAGTAGGTGQGHTHIFLDSPISTSTLTYKAQYNVTYAGGVFYLNTTYANANAAYTVLGISTLTLVEIAG